MLHDVKLRLDRNDVGWILDGLRERLASWQGTLDYFKEGFNRDDRVIEEARDEDEAQNMVNEYTRIIQEIEKQLT